jgi:hypothetical protein
VTGVQTCALPIFLDGYLADPHQMVARINDLLADASSLHAGKA